MASTKKGTPAKAKASTPAKAKATLAKAKAETATAEEPKVLTLAEVQAKNAKGEALTADEALTLIRGKLEAERTATERLQLLEAETKAQIKALRKAVRVEVKTLATVGTEKLVRDYVDGGFTVPYTTGEGDDAETVEIDVASLIDAIETLNPGREVVRLTVRYVRDEKDGNPLKVSFKLAKVEVTEAATK